MTTSPSKFVFDVTDKTWQFEVLEAPTLVLVDFWAKWCGPCRMIAPIIEELAQAYEGRVKIVKLDVDPNLAVSAQYNVRSIPYLVFFKNGKEVDHIVGAVPKAQIERMLLKNLEHVDNGT